MDETTEPEITARFAAQMMGGVAISYEPPPADGPLRRVLALGRTRPVTTVDGAAVRAACALLGDAAVAAMPPHLAQYLDEAEQVPDETSLDLSSPRPGRSSRLERAGFRPRTEPCNRRRAGG